jgi:hypothetical protein
MTTARMTSKMLWAEKDALDDIEECGQSTAADRAYYTAIVAEINRRLAAEGCNVRIVRGSGS